MGIFEPTAAHFPYNVCLELESALQMLAPHSNPLTLEGRDGVRIYQRALGDADSTETIGIYPVFWNPDRDSIEMRGKVAATEPTFQRYPIEIESMVRDQDEIRGIEVHSYLAALIKQTLFRSEYLETVMPTLQTSLNGSIERVARWGVENQTYAPLGLRGILFSFVATTTFYVDTELK